MSVRIQTAGTSLDVWINGTSEISVTDSKHGSGGVALASDEAVFTELEIGDDATYDGDLIDAKGRI